MSFLIEGQNAYITSAYIITWLVFTILIVWTLIDRAKQKQILATLESEGITRASKKEMNE